MEQTEFTFSIPNRSQDLNWRPATPPVLTEEKELFFDLETTGLKWWDGDKPVGVAIGTRDGRRWYLPFGHEGGGNLQEETVYRWMKCELRGKKLIGANIKFDNHMSRVFGIDLDEQGCELGDVMHYAALLDDSRREFNLEKLGQDFCGIGKVKGLSGPEISNYHASMVEPYAERDVELVHLLVDKMWPMMDKEELHRVRKLEDDLIFATCEMENNAAPIDMEKLHRWRKEVENKFNKGAHHLMLETDFQVNPKSPVDLERLFAHIGIDGTGELTEKGAVSYTASALKKIDNELVQKVLETRRWRELLDKYFIAYEKFIGAGDHLRYQLHQMRCDSESSSLKGTISGRYSSSQKNIQAVMAVENQLDRYGPGYVVRELFIPESGYWLAADAKQIEYRLFAHFAAPPEILKAYEEDPEMSYHEKVWDIVKQINPDFKYKPLKNLNFAKLFGAGLAKISEMINEPRRISDGFVRTYDKLIPEAGELLQLASSIAESRGYVKTILGRRARFKLGRKLHSAVNRIIQGSAADIMKKKLIEVYRKRKELCFKMRLTVHDEVCGDIPDQHHADKLKTLLDTQSFDLKVPILWDMKIGKNWAECK